MDTHIFLSRKLEKLVANSLSQVTESENDNALGSWNANIFYVDRKKCWMITNSTTFYTLILEDITNKEVKHLTEIFTHTLLVQLEVDGIKISLPDLQRVIGEIKLFPTNNDKRTLGVQNSLKVNIADWKYQYGAFINWPFRDLNHILNKVPYKQLGWKNPKETMKEILSEI